MAASLAKQDQDTDRVDHPKRDSVSADIKCDDWRLPSMDAPTNDAKALQAMLHDAVSAQPTYVDERWSARRMIAFVATTCGVFWLGLFFALRAVIA
ncbi:MAG: hypothetical protein AAF719_00035 [Pseudomonadota bacterium]